MALPIGRPSRSKTLRELADVGRRIIIASTTKAATALGRDILQP